MQLWNMLRQTNSLPLSDASAIVSTSDSPSANPKDHVLLFDHLIEVFGSQVFSGPPPKEKFLVSWQIMMGHRLEAFAQGKRQVKKGAVPKQALHATGKGILPTISEAYNVHEADYFAKDTVTDKVKRRDFEQKHPLAATLDLVNSELGCSAALPFQASFSNTRGPLININFFKVHQLCTKIFEELAIALNVNLETFVTCDLFRLTKTIAEAETRDGGRGFPMLLRRAADVVLRVAGDERVGAYVLRVEGDENLVL
ncbi:hypothetical protein BDN70DRAFT_871677 [Pholiota conissans]|uniref:Uncharacterized protein n=1 Tax=Pholiota conissans TaxID=109636 RepID=A0A9P5ZB65_9AGAR|nr:hypothetical protein BDN70DRAFT_871677 [Pholiota conissans]